MSDKVSKNVKISLLIALVAVMGLTCIKPEYPEQMILQHVGTLLLMIPILYDAVRNRLPFSAFVGLSIFTMLHLIGARYIYTYVPYREWLDVVGIGGDWFAIAAVHDNQYDRLVHLAFGLCMYPCFLHISRKWVGQKSMAAILIAWLFIQAGSLIYEVFEWKLTDWCDGGDAYNGQQGDIWDAQKDMALALIGSTIMAACYAVKGRFTITGGRA